MAVALFDGMLSEEMVVFAFGFKVIVVVSISSPFSP
jgi:hypothetical protein